MWHDTQFERDIMGVLKWAPGLEARAIRVSVCSGIVTLTGEVLSETARAEAEAAVAPVIGVVIAVNKLTVRYLNAEVARPAAITSKSCGVIRFTIGA